MTDVAPSTEDAYELLIDGKFTVPGLDLFLTSEFHALHRPAAHHGYSFALRDRQSRALVAVAHVLESTPGHFESPWRGSFGGYALAPSADAPMAVRADFVRRVEQHLRLVGARSLTLVYPPMAYHPDETAVWIHVLLQSGYAIVASELNQSIDVTGVFRDHLDAGNRKQLRKAGDAGLTCRALATDEYPEAYAVVEDNRRKKGHALSMTWAALHSMIDALPTRVRCFGVHARDGAMIASAICLLINPTTLYVFYWGEKAGAESLSPVTLLAQHLFEHCTEHAITLLDLGTSTVKGEPNEGLLRYKRHLGARISLKLTLHKSLT